MPEIVFLITIRNHSSSPHNNSDRTQWNRGYPLIRQTSTDTDHYSITHLGLALYRVVTFFKQVGSEWIRRNSPSRMDNRSWIVARWTVDRDRSLGRIHGARGIGIGESEIPSCLFSPPFSSPMYTRKRRIPANRARERERGEKSPEFFSR